MGMPFKGLAKLLIVEVGEHSPLGPSSAERWINCPASVRATANVPDPPSSFAISGTASHHLSDVCRKNGEHPRKYLGWKIAVRRGKDETVVDVDQARVDSVETFIDYVNELPGRQMFEARVQYEIFVKRGFGTMDHASAEELICHIVDYKDGQGHQVFATDNSQLKLYAVGWWLDFGWLYPDVTTFRLHIVQPRLDHDDWWDISRRDLLKWADEVVRPAALMTQRPDAPFKAGEWCSANFCRIRRTCKVRANTILSEYLGDFQNLGEASDTLDVLVESAGQIDNDEAAQYLSLMDRTVAFFKDVKAHVMSQLQQGHACADWKLVEGRSRRQWKAAPEVIADILEQNGMAEEDIWTKNLITAPQAEKLLGKGHEVMRSYVQKPTGKPKLAPGTDKRKPMTLDALEEFSNLDLEEEETPSADWD